MEAMEVKLPKLRRGRYAVVKPPRLDVVRRGAEYSLYVDGVLVGTAKRHPSGLGWKVRPEEGRDRVAPSLAEALELLRMLDHEAQWKWVKRSLQ